MNITHYNNMTCPATPLYTDQSLYYIGERVLKPLIDLVWPTLTKPQKKVVREFKAHSYFTVPGSQMYTCIRDERELYLRCFEQGTNCRICRFPY